MVFQICGTQYKTTTEHHTIAGLAEEIGAALPEVRAAIRDGILPYIRGPSGEPVIPGDYVERWLFCSQQNTRRSGNEGHD